MELQRDSASHMESNFEPNPLTPKPNQEENGALTPGLEC